MKKFLISVAMSVAISLPNVGCGGVYEIDATQAVAELRAEREVAVTEFRRALLETPLTVNSPELQMLLDYIRQLTQRIRELEAQARGEKPTPPSADQAG